MPSGPRPANYSLASAISGYSPPPWLKIPLGKQGRFNRDFTTRLSFSRMGQAGIDTNVQLCGLHGERPGVVTAANPERK